MKTSTKILLISTGIIVAFFVTGLFVIRQDLKAALRQSVHYRAYESIPVNSFNSLNMEGKWIVRLIQGRETQLEISDHETESLVGVANGVLTLKASVETYARITMPKVDILTISRGGHVDMERFEMDSLRIILRDSSTFSGHENEFKYTSFDVSGESKIQLVDDPLM